MNQWRQHLSNHAVFFKYALTGLTTVAFDAVLYYFLLQSGLHILAAKGASVTAAVVLGYALNALWSFGSPLSSRTLTRYCLVYGVSIMVNTCVNQTVTILTHKTEAGYVLAFVLATIVSLFINYFSLKKWVFPKKNSSDIG